MPRLATPVIYEPALEQLNEVRPLVLADEVKRLVSLPVLCVNPVSQGLSAVGKLVSCDKQGSLLKSSKIWADGIETQLITWPAAVMFQDIVFSQKVKGVSVYWYWEYEQPTVNWMSAGHIDSYGVIYPDVYMFLSFNGKEISFMQRGLEVYSIEFEIRGFY